MSTALKRGATHLIAGLCLFPLTSFSHHSVFGRFDQDASMEIEGRVTEVLWRNPHVYVIVEARDQNDERVIWELETNTASRLLRSGIQSDAIKVGDQVKAAGWPPTTAAREIFAIIASAVGLCYVFSSLGAVRDNPVAIWVAFILSLATSVLSALGVKRFLSAGFDFLAGHYGLQGEFYLSPYVFLFIALTSTLVVLMHFSSWRWLTQGRRG